MTEGAERKLAAIMFTDMVGYSALAQRNEALALDLLAEHQRQLRAVFLQHGGREIKAIGDGFLVELASALQAVRCAVAIQTALVERNASAASERRIQVRISLHLGDVEIRDGDVFGDGVNIAARVEPLAEAGGICITGPVFDQIRNKIDEPLVRLGQPELKNIQVPIDVYRVVLPWTQGAAPSVGRRPARRRLGTRVGVVAAAIGVVAALLVWWTTARVPHTPSAPPPDAVAPAAKKSVAVLPFVNMSSDKENEYFSDGITEDLITALSKVSGLHVAARTSSFAFKGKNEPIENIGAQLHVGAVLEGSVAKSGNQVRITAQLINVADGYHLWSDSYDRELQDIFAIRSQVAQTVAKALQVTLDAGERQRLDQKPTEDLEAYQLYLKGRHAAATLADWGTAMRYLQQAIARDPGYALAYLGLAYYYGLIVDYPMSGSEALPREREAAEKALQLDPSLAEAHTDLGLVHWWYDRDYAAARREFQTALAMQPDLALAYELNGWHLVAAGQLDEGLAASRRAVELDPLSPETNTWLGINLYLARRYDQAIKQLRTAITTDPDYWYAHLWLGRAYARTSKFSEAIAELHTAQQFAGSPKAESALGRAYADGGDRAEATKVLNHLRERMHDEFVSAAFVATVHIGLGEVDEAFAALAQAEAEHSYYVGWWKGDPELDPLRSDPRFAALLKKVGLGVVTARTDGREFPGVGKTSSI
ncbi:MAG: tetratricopeptide repeat protein [Deltaproteobacteria bacterium]|nr:tetratricopeptide repeat protein [Deltaproteobacteria bacterium]